MFNVTAVRPDKVWHAALFLSDLIKKAASRSDIQPTVLLEDCARNVAVLWMVMDDNRPCGIAITRNFGHTIEVTLAGGHKGCEWAPVLRERLRAFRKAEGAERLTSHGRKGWGRLLGVAPYGYSPELGWTFEDYG